MYIRKFLIFVQFLFIILLIIVQFSNCFLTKNKKFLQLRIAGGIIERQHQFPYQVALETVKVRSILYGTCGGSLISSNYVLTAAHCLYDNVYELLPNSTVVEIEDKYELTSEVLVVLGAYNKDDLKEKYQQRFHVKRPNLIIHEKFDVETSLNDIGLIRLPEPAVLNKFVNVVNLPAKNFKILNEMPIIVTGWGKYDDQKDENSKFLRYAKLRILENRVCRLYYPLIDDKIQICGQGNRETATCEGDSGGPFVVHNNADKTFTQIGIISYGYISGCRKGWPSVATKVGTYLKWISKHTGISIK